MVKLITVRKKFNSGVEIYFTWQIKVRAKHHRHLLTRNIPAQLENHPGRAKGISQRSEMNNNVENKYSTLFF